MARQPLRFVQASRLLLDHQLAGPRAPGGVARALSSDGAFDSSGSLAALGADDRAVLRDASLIAWKRLIDACLEQEVDFLLLGGDCFDDRDEGLRGQVELVRGFRRLADRNIPVYLTGGSTDPWTSWLPSLDLPHNVRRLGLDCGSQAVIHRGGDEDSGPAIARLQWVHSLFVDETGDMSGDDAGRSLPDVRGDSDADDLLRIAMIRGGLTCAANGGLYGSGLCYPAEDLHRLGVDYWAFSGHHAEWSYQPYEGGVACDSGGTQGFSPAETGPHGALLVNVDEDGDLETTFLSTAPVRWETLPVRLSPSVDYDDLLRDMRAELQEVARQATDRLWLVSWDVRGTGPLADNFLDPAWRNKLNAELHRQPGVPDVSVWSAAWRFAGMPRWRANELTPHPFTIDYTNALKERVAKPETALRECLDRSTLRGGAWDSRLEGVLAALDPDEIEAAARRWGLTWFDMDTAA